MKIQKKHRKLKLGLFFVLVLSGIISNVCPYEVLAKEFFVDASSGNDTNPGTKQNPFLTLERGVLDLSPGDSLFVRGGTYHRTQKSWAPPSGNSWQQPVTIKAYQNEKVIIKPLPDQTVFEFITPRRYIIMDGFIIDAGDGHDGIRMGPGNDHIRIINSEIKNAPHQGIQTSSGAFHELLNLKVHDNGLKSVPSQSHGMYVPGDNILIKDCEIFRNGSWGVHIFGSGGTPSHNIVMNNRIYDNNVLEAGGPGVGVYGGTDNLVINNLIWGNRDGIIVDFGASNTKIYNNTIYANSFYGIWVGDKADTSVVRNNIISSNGASDLLLESGSGKSLISNNLIFSKISNFEKTATLIGNLTGSTFDPKFKDPQNHDFHLKDGSPAIDSGVVIDEVKNDYDYVPRNQKATVDIGAFVFLKNSLIPTNLRIISK